MEEIKMKLTRKSIFFTVILIIGLAVLIFSIYDIMYDKGLMIAVIAAYAILFALTMILIFQSFRKDEIVINTVEEFEKKLKGGLFHFKCPICEGIFAIKKSKRNDKKPIKMTCPDCGAIGIVPSYPVSVIEEIPEKKSIKANFKCVNCSEGITVWAEGTDLYQNINVFSCPFCGQQQTMDRV
jgi:predicted RNA-binding Zn-ribbon protein involved in translation (DUF1610 family)